MSPDADGTAPGLPEARFLECQAVGLSRPSARERLLGLGGRKAPERWIPSASCPPTTDSASTSSSLLRALPTDGATPRSRGRAAPAPARRARGPSSWWCARQPTMRRANTWTTKATDTAPRLVATKVEAAAPARRQSAPAAPPPSRSACRTHPRSSGATGFDAPILAPSQDREPPVDPGRFSHQAHGLCRRPPVAEGRSARVPAAPMRADDPLAPRLPTRGAQRVMPGA
jgi:hypothetical protein